MIENEFKDVPPSSLAFLAFLGVCMYLEMKDFIKMSNKIRKIKKMSKNASLIENLQYQIVFDEDWDMRIKVEYLGKEYYSEKIKNNKIAGTTGYVDLLISLENSNEYYLDYDIIDTTKNDFCASKRDRKERRKEKNVDVPEIKAQKRNAIIKLCVLTIAMITLICMWLWLLQFMWRTDTSRIIEKNLGTLLFLTMFIVINAIVEYINNARPFIKTIKKCTRLLKYGTIVYDVDYESKNEICKYTIYTLPTGSKVILTGMKPNTSLAKALHKKVNEKVNKKSNEKMNIIIDDINPNYYEIFFN